MTECVLWRNHYGTDDLVDTLKLSVCVGGGGGGRRGYWKTTQLHLHLPYWYYQFEILKLIKWIKIFSWSILIFYKNALVTITLITS